MSSELEGFGVNFMQIDHVDIIVVFCSIWATDYIGSHEKYFIERFSVKIRF